MDHLQVDTAFGAIDTLTGGNGPPLVFLHGDTGRGDWSPFLERLAESHQVFAPSMPGYDASPLLEWMRDVRQLGLVMSAYLPALDVAVGAPIALVGRGLGAWVAAEMLVAGSALVGDAVLISPVGIRPPCGSLVDQFLIDSSDWVRLGFSTDEQFVTYYGAIASEAAIDQWELNRETTTRIAWKPYLYDLALPHLLPGVRRNTLVVSGTADRIVDASVAERYAELLPGAKHERVGGGHFLDYEQPAELATMVKEFLRAR
jgi:pimeloyl-ACP methyl ester carboxylesterase